MAIKQVNQIVNSIVGQALGRTDLVGTDTSFVSLGDAVFSSDANVESVYKVLLERVGRTVSSIRAYRSRNANMRRNPMEWGAVMQKLSMPLSDAVENPSWLGVDDDSDGNVLSPANKQKPTQKLFDKIATWEHDATLWNRQLRHAFTNAEAMMAFLNMIFTAAYNSQEVSFENLDNLCRANFIAELWNTKRAINLLALYNTQTNKSLTVGTCMHDSDFLIFSAMTIALYSQRMETMSRTFNDGSMDRHTPKDLQNLCVLADFSKALDYSAKSKVYHDEIVSMPMYVEVPFWQGSGKGNESADKDAWNFDKVSAINVDRLSDDALNVQAKGIVALLTDYEAMGTTIQNMSTSSMYNPRRKFTNYFMQADLGYYNDLSENGIVFYIAES